MAAKFFRSPSLHLHWGRYRGVPLAEVPRPYLVWLLEHVDLEEPTDWPTRRELRRQVRRLAARLQTV
jgi:hypothetical protein